MIRPTPRAALLFALSIPLAVLTVALWPERWPAVFYFPALAAALMAADLTMLLPSRRLRLDAAWPKKMSVGRPAPVTLTLAADGWSGSAAVEALLEQSGPGAPAVPVRADGLLAEGRLSLAAAVRPERRGRLALDAVWLRWRGLLGLVEASVRRPVGALTEVLPDVSGLNESALKFFAQDAAFGQKSQRLTGEGAEFDKLCDYAPGMDTRFIDWKRSARHRKLLSKEFRQERNHQIVFGFDTGHLMLEPIAGLSRLDHAITAGLILGWVSLNSGDLVGGCGFDARFRDFLKPGRGLPYFARFQSFAAGLAYGTAETNFTLGLAELGSRLKHRALVVLFTEFVDSISAELLLESLELMCRRHLVLFVTLRDPMLASLKEAPPENFHQAAKAVLADDFARERAIVLERAARLGAHSLDVPAGALSSALLNRYLVIKQRGLL